MADERLNPAQAQAVNHGRGPALVVAGAGTGKTRVLVERLARLIDEGTPPPRLLALTFTEKAAHELEDRVNERLGRFVTELPAMTFNAYGESLLRRYAVDIGLGRNFTVMGENAKVVFLREHIDELGLDYFAPLGRPDAMLGDLADYFSRLKQLVISPADHHTLVKAMPADDAAAQRNRQKYRELAGAYECYINLCRQANVVDYDDQIYLVLELFAKRPNVLAEVQATYDYVMVDEFQDTNLMQSRLVDSLAGPAANLLVVGDDDQSIYGWRGATLANILDFKDRYPSAAEVSLTENYRSTAEILDAAYSLIQNNNPDRLEHRLGINKRLTAQRHGPPPIRRHFSDLTQEISWIAADIQARLAAGTPPGDIAVLARRNVTIQELHEELEHQSIDHVVIGQRFQLFEEPLVRQLLELLRAIVDEQNDQALYHALIGPLLRQPVGLVSRLAATARRSHDNLWLLVQTESDLQPAVEQLNRWRQQSGSLSVAQLTYEIIKSSGLVDELDHPDNEAMALAVQRLPVLFANMKQFEQIAIVPSASQYVETLPALQAAGDSGEDDSLDFSSQSVNLLTIHKSKGLEWPVVYIADCSEGSFPLRRHSPALGLPPGADSSHQPADDHLAEERRLMYVAMTRARDELILTHADRHYGGSLRKPSRFLAEAFGETEIPLSGGELPVLAPPASRSLDRFALPDAKPISLPGSILDGQQVSLTVSQAQSFLDCPLNFYYTYVLNVPQPDSPSVIYGSIMHRHLEAMNRSLMEDREVLIDKLLEELRDTWPRHGFTSIRHRDRALDQAAKTLQHCHQSLLADSRRPQAVEQSFRIELPDSRLTIRGRYDAIFPLDESVEIVDYKTSTSVDTPEKAKNRATGSQQLGLYALAWQLTQGELPALLTLDFIDTGMKGSVRKTQRGIDSLTAKIMACAEHIRAGRFEPGRDHLFCIHPPIK